MEICVESIFQHVPLLLQPFDKKTKQTNKCTQWEETIDTLIIWTAITTSVCGQEKNNFTI